MNDTLEAMEKHGWRMVLLARGTKRPAGKAWDITTDRSVVCGHLASGAGIGLVCGPDSGAAVLDFDDRAAYDEMVKAVGPLQAWSTSPSGGVHCYVRWAANLPARILWNGKTVGELQRGGTELKQHVCAPPSPYPGKPSKGIPAGGRYEWLVDPRSEVPVLPAAWFDHLTAGAPAPGLPSYVLTGDARGHEWDEPEAWDGPPAGEMLRRAALQPGARQRRNGTRFQCAGCRAEGHDRHLDNGIVFTNGRFTCALEPAHRRAIAAQLGLSVDLDGEGLENDVDLDGDEPATYVDLD